MERLDIEYRRSEFQFTQDSRVFSDQAIPLIPTTDTNRATMIRSSVWGNTVNLNVTAVPDGSYKVWLYVWEDNFPQTYSYRFEGSVVLPIYNSGQAGPGANSDLIRAILRMERSMSSSTAAMLIFPVSKYGRHGSTAGQPATGCIQPDRDQNATVGSL